jgi:hypothetical protein
MSDIMSSKLRGVHSRILGACVNFRAIHTWKLELNLQIATKGRPGLFSICCKTQPLRQILQSKRTKKPDLQRRFLCSGPLSFVDTIEIWIVILNDWGVIGFLLLVSGHILVEVSKLNLKPSQTFLVSLDVAVLIRNTGVIAFLLELHKKLFTVVTPSPTWAFPQ